jgi:hypothetical protein
MPQTREDQREYRYERKFFIDQLDAWEALSLVKRHPAMFTEIYPPRYINNIYFDHPLLLNFSDNINGTALRKKARVRWYHDLFGDVDQPTLEFKIKEGLMGTKISYPFPNFKFQRGFSENYFRELMYSSNLPPEVTYYLKLVEPVLVNRYLRWYLATPNQAFRITVDAKLTYYHIKKSNNQFIFSQMDRQSTIIELKYNQEHDHLANRISAGFPFRMTRSSKYVQGIERVYL